MAVGGRPPSTTTEPTVETPAKFVHLTIPGTGDILVGRLSSLGALTGYAAGTGIRPIRGLAYALGWRPGLLGRC
ncbi:hypothetical protein [Mycobacterium riyadhense]|uniref:Uncharacterized protein n=1 Tax=Mycobacterium riyadhense TaxID=486698 RepID=A0A1X2BNI5_9MYCO|nr:hypothetical protein [Mycobacterium riyadhense]MCV7146760.1 hypothetical protein [Mycobacterium riyadhense]ORW65144.1 hypothetical protein AWC22_02955 [Mycobacterium riyadhense]